MLATTDDLRDWIERRYHDYSVSTVPVQGTYGLIWFLSPRRATSSHGFAVKTMAPESLADSKSVRDADYLRREFRMWLELPNTYNVLPALGFEDAWVGKPGGDLVHLPVMRMPRMAGSLQDWVETLERSIVDGLIALAQTFNGLIFLYEHGFEGHGDLKPSNILYTDLRGRFHLPKTGWPSEEHPWQIRVADLGWADAWVDLGFSTKALRQYLAPERLDGRVIPAQSDVFAMGVIAAELLQGRHPAPNLKAACQSDGKWKRWIVNGLRALDGISSDRIRSLIERCLHADPKNRPTPHECLHEICAELREAHGLEIEPTLALWRAPLVDAPPIAEDEHAAWAAAQWIGPGGAEARRSREQLEQRLGEIDVQDFTSCERWAVLAEPIIPLLQKEGPDVALKIIRLREAAALHLTAALGQMNRLLLEKIVARPDDLNELQLFERFSVAIRRTAGVAGVSYEQASDGTLGLGPLALSALAYSFASSARLEGLEPAITDYYLSEAIRHAPEEAVPYYFRAFWRYVRWPLSTDKSAEPIPNPDLVAEWISDLETACRLAPEWSEPKKLLESLRSQIF